MSKLKKLRFKVSELGFSARCCSCCGGEVITETHEVTKAVYCSGCLKHCLKKSPTIACRRNTRS